VPAAAKQITNKSGTFFQTKNSAKPTPNIRAKPAKCWPSKNVVVTAIAHSKTVAPFDSKTWYFSEKENLVKTGKTNTISPQCK